MNKTVVGVVIAVVVLVGGYFLLKGSPTDQDMMMHDDDSMMMGDSMKMTTKEILALGKDQKCTFSRKDANSETSGTVYFTKGKMRGDFKVTASGQTFDSHIINDGTDMYNWSSAMPTTGIKISAVGGAPSNAPNESFNVDDQMDYSCSSWHPDNSVFALPSGVTFMDAASMYPSAGTTVKPGTAPMGGSEMKMQQCAACDAISDATQKSQCKMALGCGN